METVKLRNGAEEVKPAVQAVMMSLRSLDPIAQYELVMKARDRDHELFGHSGEKLKALKLIEPNGRMHDTVRNVVLSAAEGDGLNMTIGSPVA